VREGMCGVLPLKAREKERGRARNGSPLYVGIGNEERCKK